MMAAGIAWTRTSWPSESFGERLRPSGCHSHGWHGFRRGIASNLYALGASDKVVQRILRHAKAHVTKELYIKALAPDVLEAMQRMQPVVAALQGPEAGQQAN